MRLNVKYNASYLCNKILCEQLEKQNIQYQNIGFAEIDLPDNTNPETLEILKEQLAHYEIEVISDNKALLIQRIKDAIIDLVMKEDDLPTEKISVHLAKTVHHSYGYISNLFSETCYTTIENFIILQKIEKVKSLILSEALTLSEISYKMNYSSVAHLSAQFKKVTGLTPTAFVKIIKRRQGRGEE